MAPGIAAGLMSLVMPACLQADGAVLFPSAVNQNYVPLLEANRPQRALALVAGGGGLERLTSDRSAGYAVLAFAMPADRPMLLLFAHDSRATVRVRLLDRPPWDDPLSAQQLALEPRWTLGRSERMIDGAWISLAAAAPSRQLFLLVEENGSNDADFAPVIAELFDPELPLPFHSLAKYWNNRSVAADVASPLERRQRLGTQQVWQSAR